MILRDLGEFNLIKRISRRVKLSKKVANGIGDDAAVLRYKKDKYLLFTSDMLLEDVHFYRRSGAYLIGKKCLSSNISDIAAMGGLPESALVSLGAPPSLSVRYIDMLYRGMRDTAKRFGVDLVGGDTVASKKIIVNIALLGSVEKDNLVLRSGAKAGDAIFVTGSIGDASKGKHLDFIPRLKESRFLVRNFNINSMIDVSDGLLADLGHILEASRAGAVVCEKGVPLSKNVKGFSEAVTEGEDFELVFTLPQKAALKLEKAWPFKTRLSRIGRICAWRNGFCIIKNNGSEQKIKPSGYSHF